VHDDAGEKEGGRMVGVGGLDLGFRKTLRTAISRTFISCVIIYLVRQAHYKFYRSLFIPIYRGGTP
jgi:hypothetical protein